MFPAQPWPALSRKRGRDDDDDDDDDDFQSMGFGAHRDKRYVATLTYPSFNSHRTKQPQTLNSFQPPASFQIPLTITPDHSSNENSPVKEDSEDSSFFSPYASSPLIIPDCESSSQMRQASLAFSMASSQDVTMYSDHDMTEAESYNLSPGPYQPDRNDATTIRERIPTPRHTNFFNSSYMNSTDLQPRGHRQLIRLPSPISEGEPSPSLQLAGLACVSMDLESPPLPQPMCNSRTEETSPSPRKKGHSRSKYSLRDWSGFSGAAAMGGKRKFSMGYRHDCEKCRNNVPGHFSHIDIDYD